MRAHLNDLGTSAEVASKVGVSSSAIRALTTDSDKNPWQAPGLEICVALDAFLVGDGRPAALTALREALDDAVSILDGARSVRRSFERARDRADHLNSPLTAEIADYLRALHEALGSALPWHPPGGIDAAFEDRKVRVFHEINADTALNGQVHSYRRGVVEGETDWASSLGSIRLAVVLGDAGYGKTWSLRRHARLLCERGLAALEAGAPPCDVEIPLWLHCADLGEEWRAGSAPAEALLDAAMLVVRGHSERRTRGVRMLLADRLSEGSGAGVHLLLDAYDEVFDDNGRECLDQALGWIGRSVRVDTVLNVVLTSRSVGFVCPFLRGSGGAPDHAERVAPRYLLLGALRQPQVIHLWHRWFALKDLPFPEERLTRLLTADSPLREYVRVPLIAAFCAWVAEREEVGDSRAALFEQVVQRFVELGWKQGDRAPHGDATRQDPARQISVRKALEQLAWVMATTGNRWRDAVSVEECDRCLSDGGLPLPSGRSRTDALVRVHGVLLYLGAFGAAPATGPWVSGPLVVWVHPVVHQYLVAFRLLQLPGAELDQWLSDALLRPEWSETIVFAMELESGPEPGEDHG
ncbi:NACHT domain-containing protein [Streptomyces sp. NPDC091280]|uniref:NACHT domain-containing protein n=1 Tax=Streptomyces sp. NPDC091280 TaxID=3365984 RepID=UPI003805D254